MDWTEVALLLATGLSAGFAAGLLGIGGGVIFTPVLLYYFRSIGVAESVLTELTIGSGLFCTLVTALASAYYHYREASVALRVALVAGGFSAAAIFLMVRFVTTQPWYSSTVLELIFGVLLLWVAGRMMQATPSEEEEEGARENGRRQNLPLLAGTGLAAGSISAAVGVGGGIVLVPAYRNMLRLPMRLTVGTSSATIVLISLAGVLNYMALGWGAPALPASTFGYVDAGRAALLALPSALSAQWGVAVAHRVNTRSLRWAFAALAVFVALRMAGRALFG